MGPSTAPSEAAPLTAEVGSVPLPASFSPARRSPSSSSTPGGTSAPVRLGFGGRGLGPQPLDLLGAAGQVGIGSREIRGIRFRVEVAVCEGGSHRQPTSGTKPESAKAATDFRLQGHAELLPVNEFSSDREKHSATNQQH